MLECCGWLTECCSNVVAQLVRVLSSMSVCQYCQNVLSGCQGRATRLLRCSEWFQHIASMFQIAYAIIYGCQICYTGKTVKKPPSMCLRCSLLQIWLVSLLQCKGTVTFTVALQNSTNHFSRNLCGMKFQVGHANSLN